MNIGNQEYYNDENEENFKLMQQGDKYAREKLIKDNMPLAIKLAKSYTKMQGVEVLDVMQCAYEGLIMAIDGFNVDLNYKFSTYAYWVIRNHLINFIINECYMIRIPQRTRSVIAEIIDFQTSHAEKYGCNPSVEEIAKYLNITEKKIVELMQYIAQPISYNKTNLEGEEYLLDMENDSNNRFYDFSINTPENMFIDKEAIINIGKIMQDVLNQREYTFICMHGGIFGYDKNNFEKIGNKYGITRQAVERTVKVAKEKVKIRLKKYGYGVD